MLRPRIKSVFPPFPLSDGRIRIGLGVYGLGGEIQDTERGHVWRLLGLLDGSRTTDDVVAAMQRSEPSLTAAEVHDALTTLIDAGYVEDASLAPPAGLTSAELERYRRNMEFFSYFHRPGATKYDPQVRLGQSRVTVLGVGGLGTYVAMSLAAMGVGDLLLVDHDTVEMHNLNRQVLYTEQDVGESKVTAAARRLAEINPHVRITALATRVSGVDDARACMAGRDLLVCAADRPRVRLYTWVNAAAIAEGMPWLRGTNNGLTASVILHVPGETACFECEQRRFHTTYPWYEDIFRHATTALGEQTLNPCISPVAGLLGHLASLEIMKHLTNIAQPVVRGRTLVVDLQTMEIRLDEGQRWADCPACGAGSRAAEVASAWTATS